MPALLLHAVERSIAQVNAPTAQRITAALASISINGGHPGRFLGAAPRITRVAEVGDAFVTTAAWPYAWTTTAGEDVVRRVLEDQARLALAEVSSGWTVTAQTFNPTTNGAITWWESGQASITRTRDEFPTFDQRLAPRENPTGPTSAATNPGGHGDNVGAGLRSLGSNVLEPLAWLAGIGLAGYLLWQWTRSD